MGSPPAFELYDHQSPAAETINLAAKLPNLVRELSVLLDQRLGRPQPASNE
jgi:hypothetical protein